MKITIEYIASVYTAAGWRPVTICAAADQVSAGTALVTAVIKIDGEAPKGYTSRTGAKRQVYNANGIANREIGKKKRLSSCKILRHLL